MMISCSCCDRRSGFGDVTCGCSPAHYYCRRCLLCEVHCACGTGRKIVVTDECIDPPVFEAIDRRPLKGAKARRDDEPDEFVLVWDGRCSARSLSRLTLAGKAGNPLETPQ